MYDKIHYKLKKKKICKKKKKEHAVIVQVYKWNIWVFSYLKVKELRH